jgi:uncharacterized protein involved in exopolysaccharide biosynthesis
MSTRTDDIADLAEPAYEAERPGTPVDPGRLWMSVKRDWRWIPIGGASWAALGIAVALLFIKPTYKAETVLVWQPTADSHADWRQLTTQAGSVKLPGALRKVIARLKLDIPVRTLDKQVDVWFDSNSNLVTVIGSGPRARDARILSTTVVQVFLDQQHEVLQSRAEAVAKALEKDLASAQAQLRVTSDAFDQFRAANGVTDIEHETKLAIENAAHVKDLLQQARADVSSLEARASGLGSESRRQSRTSVQSSNTVNPDAVKLAELRSELATARARYSPGHPRLASLEAQIAALEARTGKGSEVVGVTMGANPEYQSLQATLSTTRVEQETTAKRIKSYEQFVQAADQRVATLTTLESKARTFEADIDLLQKRITSLQSQLSEARDAARTPPTEWRVLTPAVDPEWPERSKRRIVAAAMPIAGMLVALLALLLRPILNGRVYTAREAAYWANLPVIGSSAWPRNREMFFSLVDDLGDHGALVRGYTLVLGASGREKPLAEELAYWLGGNLVGGRREGVATRVENAPIATPSPSPRPPASNATTRMDGTPLEAENLRPAAAGQHQSAGTTVAEPISNRPVLGSEALVSLPRGGAALGPHPTEGTHAWLGATDGPALRRAARMADRVIVLLTSGGELFTEVAGIRTRLGRNHGVGVVLLGLGSELLELPDRVGDVDGFWRSTQSRRPGKA